MIIRRSAKIDGNQPEIVAALRKLGYSVLLLYQVGKGCPDAAIGKDGTTWLAEFKDGSLPPSKRRLTPDEEGILAGMAWQPDPDRKRG